MDLKSTFGQYESVTQITMFLNGEKYTHTELDPKTLKQGEMTKIRCKKGYRVSYNPKNILFFETHPEQLHEKESNTRPRPPTQ